MQQCNCTNTYKYPENGKDVCVICGEDWPSHDKATIRKAKELYHDHMNLSCTNDFMWDQCSKEYRDAWLLIAEESLE